MNKKKISLFLVILMVAAIFAGCNVNEIGYLNLSVEMNKLTQMEIKHTTQIEISKEITGNDKNSKIDVDIQGELNIDDLNKIYMDLDIKLKVDGEASTNPINLIMADDKFYVSKNLLSELLKFKDDFNLGLNEVDILIAEKLTEELKDFDYIALPSLNNGIVGAGELNFPVASFTYKDNNEVLESAKKYLTNAFKGFESKLIKKTSNGYSMELNAEDAWSFVTRLVEYISKNKELFFDETVKYFEAIYDNMEIRDGLEAVETKSVIEDLKDQKQDFYDAIDEIYEMIKTMETENKEEIDGYIDMLGESYLKNEFYKEGKGFVQNIDAQLMIEGVLAGSIKSKTTMTPKDVKKASAPNKFISTEELEKITEKLDKIYNPVVEVSIIWDRTSYARLADISSIKLNGKEASYYSSSYVIIENSIYLPLRYICEDLGEQVEWDAVNKKAYIIRGNEKIDMTGVIIDNTTMVKIRDFEKLLYRVEYIEDGDFSQAMIIRTK